MAALFGFKLKTPKILDKMIDEFNEYMKPSENKSAFNVLKSQNILDNNNEKQNLQDQRTTSKKFQRTASKKFGRSIKSFNL